MREGKSGAVRRGEMNPLHRVRQGGQVGADFEHWIRLDPRAGGEGGGQLRQCRDPNSPILAALSIAINWIFQNQRAKFKSKRLRSHNATMGNTVY